MRCSAHVLGTPRHKPRSKSSALSLGPENLRNLSFNGCNAACPSDGSKNEVNAPLKTRLAVHSVNPENAEVRLLAVSPVSPFSNALLVFVCVYVCVLFVV